MAAAAAEPATAQRFFQCFSDALIEEDPQAALEELTKALEQKSDDAQYYCQRAYCHILLGNYCDAVADVKRSLELNPNNSTAVMRKGICEYHEKNYASALETFTEGQKLDSAGANFIAWIKRCQEALNGSESEVSASQRTQSKIKYDWYQTESQVIITLMIKNVQKNDVNVEFSEKEIEIKMKKPEAVRWEKLEGQGDVPTSKQFIADVKNLYPSSSHYTRNWDKLVGEIKEEEKNEKLEGDAALNKLFQQIYSDGSDEVKRAMNKSFMESGGTVLSTNWSDVGKRKVEINPPDDMEWKKY
nr:protein SGT1 homolog isoform X2 [Marmota flaviventris]